MRQPAFSFLTTAYRTADTLSRTIESVLAQTRADWELIIVDNGYDDAIADVVAPFLADPRIRFARQENRGASGGQMAAAARARGRYLVPLNSDDAITPEFCAQTGDLLDAEPGVAAVTTDAYKFVDPGERRLARSYLADAGVRARPDGLVPLRLADVVDGPTPYYTAAIRRKVWDAVGGLESDTPLVCDLDFWLRVLVEGHDVRMIPERLGRYRVEAGSVSRPDDHERAEQFEAQQERAMRRAVERSGEPDAEAAFERWVRRVRYAQHMRRARVAFQEGDLDAARGHVRAAYALRRSLRSATVLVSLRLAPRLLAAVHPTKQRLQKAVDGVRRLSWRDRLRRRSPRSTS
jgi:glycosyltransferase involved in cell wall biosynthesis